MRILGVIAEYNPFHNGHAYQLHQARQQSGADYVVVVMSSCFTQRGDAAILSPAQRARMALACGADAVFSLPVQWAVGNAERFALGGVALLKALGADAISFGAETADFSRLSSCAELLETQNDSIRSALRLHMEQGLSYPAALSAAVGDSLLAAPNNTLAVCYLRAMQQLGASFDVYPIHRQADYHATTLTSAPPSATALRSAIIRGDWQALSPHIPPAALEILCSCGLNGSLHLPHQLDQALTYRLRTMTDTEWDALPDLSEGIEDRLRSSAHAHTGREAILQAAKTKRYPYARLSRLCTHALLGITKQQLLNEPLPTAAWLLGFRRESQALLSQVKKSGFPIIGKAADYPPKEAWFRTELLAYDLWALGVGLPTGLGFTQGVVCL